MEDFGSCDSHLLEDDVTFDSLHASLLKSIKRGGFTKPTIVQNQCIPVILEGKDLLVRARTGSGKTMAYSIPIIQKLLLLNSEKKSIRVIILVPTNELVDQVYKAIEILLNGNENITVSSLLSEDKKVEMTKLKEKPTIIICTPKKIVDAMKNGNLNLKEEEINTLVIDEADLVLSFGYENDVKYLIKCLPPNCQSVLMSATLSEDILKLKKLLLHNPIILKLEEDSKKNLMEQYMKVTENDKFLLVFALIKLNIIKGKVLFFVNSIEKAYRLKLFLEQFSIGCGVLNSELPFNSRINILSSYNSGEFEYLIATDESLSEDMFTYTEDEDGDGEEVEDSDDDNDDEDEVEDEENDDDDESDNENEKIEEEEKLESDDEEEDFDLDEDLDSIPHEENIKTNKKKKIAKYKENDYGVSRGFDFKNVDMVINFDFPLTKESYLHRIGRSGRANLKGSALSLVINGNNTENKVLKDIQDFNPSIDGINQPHLLVFDINEINRFRYRVEDILNNITRNMIKEARINELKQEILNSEKLENHFDEHPDELNLLEHDRALLPKKVKRHLKIIPNYLLPTVLQKNENSELKEKVNKRRTYNINKNKSASGDPLQSITLGLDNMPINNSLKQMEDPKFSILSARNRWKRRHHKKPKKGGNKRRKI